MEKQPNHCIKCNVTSCANHCAYGEYCSLNTVNIGTHEKNPTMCECVDCKSFVLGNTKTCNCNPCNCNPCDCGK